MSIYQVLQYSDGEIDPLIDSDTVFIEERFSWGATLLPPIWAVIHGLWLELLAWLVAMAILGGVAYLFGDEVSFYLYVIGAVFIGFEATAIRAAAYSRQGYNVVGDIIAAGEDLAEMEWMKLRAAA